MDRKIRLLAAALCAAAVVCAAAEPEASWGTKAADVAELIARSGPVHSLVVPARAASEVVTFLQSSEVDELVPEEFSEFVSSDSAGAKGAGLKKVAKAVAGKKPTVKQDAAVKKTEATIKKMKAKIAGKTKAIKKDTEEQKVVAKAARKAAIKAGPNDSKVIASKAKAKAMAKKISRALGKPRVKKWSKKNVHLPKQYKGKLSLPKNFHVPSKGQTEKKIWEATPPGIHTNAEYWKLKQLREEYHYKKGYEHMREHLLRKQLRRHYASKLERDHMRRKIDTLRRERALDEYGPGADYKPFHWGQYANAHSASTQIVKEADKTAAAKKTQQSLHTAAKDIVDGKD